MSLDVKDNTAECRYELFEDGERRGFADYELVGDRISVLYVKIDEAHEGGGYGRALVNAMLQDARERKLGVLPFCPFVKAMIGRNRERYLDLVPEDSRALFGFES